MKFLIYGANGWIGKARVNVIPDLRTEIQLYQPTHVISFIGRTHGTFEGEYIGTIDYLEKKRKIG